MADLRDRRALHLAAETAEGLNDSGLLRFGSDELIPGADAALIAPDFRGELLRRPVRPLAQTRVRREGIETGIGDLAPLETDGADVIVVLHRVGGDDDVADVDPRIERPRDADVDDLVRAEVRDEDLRADARVHLADAGLDDDGVRAPKRADGKLHARDRLRARDLHGLPQSRDLLLHCADDADTHMFAPFRPPQRTLSLPVTIKEDAPVFK